MDIKNIKPDFVLDCVGLACPMPIFKTSNKIKELQPGQVLEIQSASCGFTVQVITCPKRWHCRQSWDWRERHISAERFFRWRRYLRWCAAWISGLSVTGAISLATNTCFQ